MEIDEKDLRIDTFRSAAPWVTDSSVRVTHIPTGLFATCSKHKSQHKNKLEAIKKLRQGRARISTNGSE